MMFSSALLAQAFDRKMNFRVAELKIPAFKLRESG
jgi:hypothetical protein